MHRAVFTALPLAGDYVLSSTGYSWSVRRSNADGSGQSILVGERDRALAISYILACADADATDAWETVGSGSFWRIAGYRPS